MKTLVEMLRDTSGDVRRQAASSLERLGNEARPAVPALIETLRDKMAGVRHQAAVSLGRLGTKAGPAVPALIDRIADDVWTTGFDTQDNLSGNTSKDAALSALRRLSPERSEEALLRAAISKNWTVRFWAADNLLLNPILGPQSENRKSPKVLPE